MNKRAIIFMMGISGLVSFAAAATPQGSKIAASSSTAVAVDSTTAQGQEKAIKFQPFSIFCDARSKQNHYAPSGWMGDTSDLKFTGSYIDNQKLGKNCLKITYLAKGPKGWAGIYWQNPANNWGDKKGGYNLNGAQALTFWARGEKGGERISEFKIGGLSGKYPDSDVAWTGPVKLTNEWKQYRIELKGKDLRYINGGFCFTILKADNPSGSTFYLDEIQYE